MTATRPRRTLVGTGGYGIGYYERVYLADEWIEIDETDGGEIRRTRVPYEEVLFVTRHVSRGWVLGIVLALPALSFLLLSIALLVGGTADPDTSVGAIAVGIVGLAFGTISVLSIGVGTSVVGVYGERSKARLRFIRRGRAKAAAESVLARVRRARRAAEDAAGPPPVPEPTGPPPPPPPVADAPP